LYFAFTKHTLANIETTHKALFGYEGLVKYFAFKKARRRLDITNPFVLKTMILLKVQPFCS
jgi:hypothetical protein